MSHDGQKLEEHVRFSALPRPFPRPVPFEAAVEQHHVLATDAPTAPGGGIRMFHLYRPLNALIPDPGILRNWNLKLPLHV
jgi:hypothetical protein